MKIKRITEIKYDVKPLEATLLSAEEAKTLLTKEDRLYWRWWWLRTSGYTWNRTAYIEHDYTYSHRGNEVDCSDGCVRPALKFESENLKIGDILKFAGKEFKVISENLAFCTTDIGYHRFDQQSNNYETSEIKQYIDKWFEENLEK